LENATARPSRHGRACPGHPRLPFGQRFSSKLWAAPAGRDVRQKAKFTHPPNAITPVQSCPEKYFDFVFSETMVSYTHPAPSQRGVARDRHDTRGGDAVAATMPQRVLGAWTNGSSRT
jgi:hypothetical protein